MVRLRRAYIAKFPSLGGGSDLAPLVRARERGCVCGADSHREVEHSATARVVKQAVAVERGPECCGSGAAE